jgi:hypothetical protein
VGSEVHVSLLLRDLARGMDDPLFPDRPFIRAALGDDLYGIDGETWRLSASGGCCRSAASCSALPNPAPAA